MAHSHRWINRARLLRDNTSPALAIVRIFRVRSRHFPPFPDCSGGEKQLDNSGFIKELWNFGLRQEEETM